MDLNSNPWDEHAEAYGRFVSQRLQADSERNLLLTAMPALLGDVGSREVLDACCGEGFLSRILAARGARITGIDLSPRLIAMARTKEPPGTIDYREGDLSRPLPEFAGRFDRIGSHLALNDVRDLRGFAATLTSLAAPGARLVLAINNPYSSVVRGHITDDFESGAFGVYGGLREMGITAPYYHRTLEEYLDAFLIEGLRLVKLDDVPDRASYAPILPEGCRFPRLMILAFDKERVA